ncbi:MULTISPECIES: hypothetical protein [Paenibacillus]|uniref:Uncharacterized protein n=1 Tax=Paenibacillus illinoisensis TaxID=59845 RepID=A0A2W0C941_9BACL|nr:MULTISPECIES: hypothetical protein [Paenibacillus]MBM6386697.1 hypothetical protein [Paenibacillus sp.]PAD31743.1 hypothetical protein CHH60_10490 [Paenibacillus sp. 7523-1]PYY28597.1 Uncharacterized protein PIL02S_03803 [Paenibacillus illinoisensis]
MIRKHLVRSLVSLSIVFVVGACSVQTEEQSISGMIEHSLQEMVNESVIMSSSNPNDYIAGNREAYGLILNTGEEGLDVLLQKLESSSDNGLREWIMAQASTEMLGEQNSVNEWNSGKDWLRQYKMSEE